MTVNELARVLATLVAQGHGDKQVEFESGEGPAYDAFGIVVDGPRVALDATAEPGSLDIG